MCRTTATRLGRVARLGVIAAPPTRGGRPGGGTGARAGLVVGTRRRGSRAGIRPRASVRSRARGRTLGVGARRVGTRRPRIRAAGARRRRTIALPLKGRWTRGARARGRVSVARLSIGSAVALRVHAAGAIVSATARVAVRVLVVGHGHPLLLPQGRGPGGVARKATPPNGPLLAGLLELANEAGEHALGLAELLANRLRDLCSIIG